MHRSTSRADCSWPCSSRWPASGSLLASFVDVGVIWLNHHALFRRIRHVDIGLNRLHLGLLAGAMVIPFPTSVNADADADTFASPDAGDDRRAAVLQYAVAATLMSSAWFATFAYLRRYPHLLAQDTTAPWASAQRARPLIGISGYTACAAIGWFVDASFGLLSIAAMIAFHAVTSQGVRGGPLRLIACRRRSVRGGDDSKAGEPRRSADRRPARASPPDRPVRR